jgi:hypothetical protein
VASFERGLTWFGGAVKKGTITSFTVQAFFTLVEEYDGELEENILQLISRVNWKCWLDLLPNCYEIYPGTFIQKVWQCC